MKNITTRTLLIIILLFGFISFGKNIISKDFADSSKIETEDSAYSNLSNILAEELKKNPNARFSIGYIDHDKVPDVFVSTGSSHISGVKIYLSAYDDFIEVKAPDNNGFGEFGKIEYIPYKSTACDHNVNYGEEHFTFYRTFRTGTRLLCSLKRVNREATEYYIDDEVVSKGKFERTLNEYYNHQNYVSTFEYSDSFDITEENIKYALDHKQPLSSVLINKNDKETITLYSKDEKSIEVKPSEIEAYNEKGWYTAPASGKAELLEMLYGTWVAEDEQHSVGTPFMDFQGEKVDTGWSTEYGSYGHIESITLARNNTYKVRVKTTPLDLDGEYGEVYNNEYHIYYEGGNEFQTIRDDGYKGKWKYVGTLEDVQRFKTESAFDEGKVSEQEKISEESIMTTDVIAKIEEYQKNKRVENIDVTAEMLPEIQGYWMWLTFLKENNGIFVMKIKGKEYSEFFYASEIMREGKITSIKGNKDGVLEVNCVCQDVELLEFGESIFTPEYDYSWNMLSGDDFEKSLITTNSTGDTDCWLFMGKTKEEVYNNMEEWLDY